MWKVVREIWKEKMRRVEQKCGGNGVSVGEDVRGDGERDGVSHNEPLSQTLQLEQVVRESEPAGLMSLSL